MVFSISFSTLLYCGNSLCMRLGSIVKFPQLLFTFTQSIMASEFGILLRFFCGSFSVCLKILKLSGIDLGILSIFAVTG